MENNCCASDKKENKGILRGILLGILPHSFCIGFIVFSVIGVASAAAIFKKMMVVPYFLQILTLFSFIMATISAIFYLKKNDCLCLKGIKNKWKYLLVLYGVTIFTNLFMFSYVLPALANASFKNPGPLVAQNLANLSLKVEIPCSGHAPLIMDELKKDGGVKNINFENPDIFQISYDPSQTSKEKIESLDIFKTYKLVE